MAIGENDEGLVNRLAGKGAASSLQQLSALRFSAWQRIAAGRGGCGPLTRLFPFS